MSRGIQAILGRRGALVAATALAWIVGLAGVARAADYCISVGGYVYVAKNFHIPASGKCKPFNGFMDHPTYVTSGVLGQGCHTSDGSQLIFTLTEACAFPQSEDLTTSVHYIRIDAATGMGDDYFHNAGGETGRQQAVAIPCDQPVVAIR